MRAHALLHPVLFCATAVLVLTAPFAVACAAENPQSAKPAAMCPKTLYLETITVRVFETSDAAENMLRSACIQASQRALANWRTQALASPHADTRACALRMGAQGCLMGQAFTQPHCTDVVCRLTQKCVVTLVRLDAASPQA